MVNGDGRCPSFGGPFLNICLVATLFRILKHSENVPFPLLNTQPMISGSLGTVFQPSNAWVNLLNVSNEGDRHILPGRAFHKLGTITEKALSLVHANQAAPPPVALAPTRPHLPITGSKMVGTCALLGNRFLVI